MSVIDLDHPPVATPPPAPRRPTRRLLTALAILTTGAVLGSAATGTYLRQRTERSLDDEISVLVLPDTGPQSNDAGIGGVIVHGKVTDATLSRRVTLVNAGPLPVNVLSFSVVRPGLTVRAVEKHRWIRRGESVQADADVKIICSAGLPIGLLSVRLAIRTDDDRDRTATAVLDASQWNDQARVACTGNLS
ncbi:hypothetical protein ACPCHT_14475 [Nucisporomicrobium flavum]|jgi:hypothetical protein|uniref:hypothetical protein n=1 Tax=Nucisporomicrobium flavum TaxID=2785915 RepID=UPI0018F31CD2|nr:hypothetical protein [Nucisporomicrobium flavum]